MVALNRRPPDRSLAVSGALFEGRIVRRRAGNPRRERRACRAHYPRVMRDVPRGLGARRQADLIGQRRARGAGRHRRSTGRSGERARTQPGAAAREAGRRYGRLPHSLRLSVGTRRRRRLVQPRRFLVRPICGRVPSAEHRSNHCRINILDPRRLPVRLAILVHHHRPHALGEVGMPHGRARQREFGVEALRQRHICPATQRLQRPAQRRRRHRAQHAQRPRRPLIPHAIEPPNDLAHAVRAEALIDRGPLRRQREFRQRRGVRAKRPRPILRQRPRQRGKSARGTKCVANPACTASPP